MYACALYHSSILTTYIGAGDATEIVDVLVTSLKVSYKFVIIMHFYYWYNAFRHFNVTISIHNCYRKTSLISRSMRLSRPGLWDMEQLYQGTMTLT